MLRTAITSQRCRSVQCSLTSNPSVRAWYSDSPKMEAPQISGHIKILIFNLAVSQWPGHNMPNPVCLTGKLMKLNSLMFVKLSEVF